MNNLRLLIFSAVLLLTPLSADTAETVTSAHSAYPEVREDGEAGATLPETDRQASQTDEAGVAAGSTSADVKPADRATEKGHDGPSGKKKEPLKPDPNRRWIMKQPKYTKTKTSPKAGKPIVWKDAAQKKRCQSFTKELDVQYKNARYYSIQGDRCKTAHYSGAFLDIVDQCKTGCPDGFVANAGFDRLFIRNMQQLKALGTKSCLGETGPPPGKPSTPVAPKP